MIDFTRAYHLGVRVPDIGSAMNEMGDSLGISWCSLQEREQNVWLPDVGATTIPLRFTYSAEGPMHVELLEGAPESIWDGRLSPGAHHIGVWSDDVRGETQRLVEAGWTLLMAQAPPDDGFGAFTYVQPPSGLIVELVWSAIEPMFQRWFAGGSLG
ncbi:MAG: VOC family protein [Actinomycetota bacterium]|nr:VOC family protein [Actinomycetota bacterium]MDA2970562.1 VOC family protein [Actinomycetota bacterium]MDA3001638.1 VOC family protein [Actinomycetota bacterium]